MRHRGGVQKVHDSRHELLLAHGWTPGSGSSSAKNWSKSRLDKLREDGDETGPERPRNARFLDELVDRFAAIGFEWSGELVTAKNRNGRPRVLQQWVINYTNYPTKDGQRLTLAEMLETEPQEVDQWEKILPPDVLSDMNKPAPESFTKILEIMNGTGIGYKGIDEVSWLPALRPFRLPAAFGHQIENLAQALFLFYEAVMTCLSDPAMQQLITHKKPNSIPDITWPSIPEFARPDIVIFDDPVSGKLKARMTEIESAPAGQGMAHAMSLGYMGDSRIVDTFVEYLDGRDYLIVATSEWSEYLRDLAVFVRALRERGVNARIIFDKDLETIDKASRASWKAPAGAPAWVVEKWDNSFLSHLEDFGERFVFGPEALPALASERLVFFRFGYYDNFSEEMLKLMRSWCENGATVTNGLHWAFENKSLMAALHVVSVRKWIKDRDPEALRVLDDHFAETRLLVRNNWDKNPAMMAVETASVRDQRSFWISKFAGWDGNNQSWGARSFSVGRGASSGQWSEEILVRAALPHPVVMQHMIHSTVNAALFVGRSGVATLKRGLRTRLTPFFLNRGRSHPNSVGATITLRRGNRVHGATDAIEGPVIYED